MINDVWVTPKIFYRIKKNGTLYIVKKDSSTTLGKVMTPYKKGIPTKWVAERISIVFNVDLEEITRIFSKYWEWRGKNRIDLPLTIHLTHFQSKIMLELVDKEIDNLQDEAEEFEDYLRNLDKIAKILNGWLEAFAE